MDNTNNIIIKELTHIQGELTSLWGLLNNAYEYDDVAEKTSIKAVSEWFDENAVAFSDNKDIDLGEEIEDRLMMVHQLVNTILENGELTEDEARETVIVVDKTQNMISEKLQKISK